MLLCLLSMRLFRLYIALFCHTVNKEHVTSVFCISSCIKCFRFFGNESEDVAQWYMDCTDTLGFFINKKNAHPAHDS